MNCTLDELEEVSEDGGANPSNTDAVAPISDGERDADCTNNKHYVLNHVITIQN